MLSKERIEAIRKGAEKDAALLPMEHQESFIAATVETEVKLNEAIDNVLEDLRRNMSDFVVADIPHNPLAVATAIEANTIKVKEVLMKLFVAITPVGNAGVKVVMCDAVRQGINHLKEASFRRDILLKRIGGEKEQ